MDTILIVREYIADFGCYVQMLMALDGVPTICGMSRQQLKYVLQVLEITTISRISFKMFAVITALCERVTSLDYLVKEMVEGLDLTETEWKLNFYREMFFVTGDRSVTFISDESLRIEMKAGGLSQNQEDHVIRHISQASDDGKTVESRQGYAHTVINMGLQTVYSATIDHDALVTLNQDFMIHRLAAIEDAALDKEMLGHGELVKLIWDKSEQSCSCDSQSGHVS